MSKEGVVSTRPPWRQRDSQADLCRRILWDNSTSPRPCASPETEKSFIGGLLQAFPQSLGQSLAGH